jgi:uncharacterized membrane protein YgcG
MFNIKQGVVKEMKKVAVLLSGIAMFFIGAMVYAGEWAVDTPETGMYVFRNETGTFKGTKSILFMCSNGLRMRKNFPLDKLPADVLKNAKQAFLRIYCNLNDYSWSKPKINGANEELCFVINGRKLICKTSDPRFPLKYSKAAPQRYQWVDVEFPVAWLKDGKLDVIVHKMNGAGCDDFFYPGIDITVPNSDSLVSHDGGASWNKSYGCFKDNQGEYMLRLVLKTAGSENTTSGSNASSGRTSSGRGRSSGNTSGSGRPGGGGRTR